MRPVTTPLLFTIALVGFSACGTGTGGVAIDEPTPTIFPETDEVSQKTDEDEVTTTSSTTTTLPLEQRLPELNDDGRARVIITPTGIVVPVLAHIDGGWIVQTPCGNEAEITGGVPVSAAHVVIDAGHGGSETGVVGEAGTRESDLNLTVARLVAAELRLLGVEVVLTRTSDTRSTLANRALIATTLRANAFVSIHHNAQPDGPTSGPGTETWYQIDDAESRRLSGLVYEEVVAALSSQEIAWVSDTDAGVKYRLNQRGTDYYGILRNAEGVPSTLAELAFLSNPEEEQLLAMPEIQAAEATAVAAGVVRFLGSDDLGSGFVEAYERLEPAGSGGGVAGCEDPPLQ